MLGIGSAIGGLWINDPRRNNVAESKIAQLIAATDVGLLTPATLVSNDRASILGFAKPFNNGVVIKGLDAPYFRRGGKELFMFTTTLNGQLHSKEAYAAAPLIVQERIEPRLDLRVTVVGRKVFAASPKQQVPYQDWREAPEPISFEPVDVPAGLRQLCLRFLDRFGLRFGAFDFAVRHNAYFFLEMNPNGEWGWLQAAGLPIAEALANELLTGTA